MRKRAMRKRAILFAASFLAPVAILASASLVYLFRPFHDPYRDLRNRAEQEVGVERLQEWAISVLDKPPQAFARGTDNVIREEDLPDDIRRLLAGEGVVMYVKRHAESGEEEHVLFACGGGFHHHGLRVGRRGFEPSPDIQFRFERLGDGVWGLDER